MKNKCSTNVPKLDQGRAARPGRAPLSGPFYAVQIRFSAVAILCAEDTRIL